MDACASRRGAGGRRRPGACARRAWPWRAGSRRAIADLDEAVQLAARRCRSATTSSCAARPPRGSRASGSRREPPACSSRSRRWPTWSRRRPRTCSCARASSRRARARRRARPPLSTRRCRSTRATPLPAELLGALSAWDGEAVPVAEAAAAYVEAARRRAARRPGRGGARGPLASVRNGPGERRGGGGAGACARARRRHGAADEALRAHARAVARSIRRARCGCRAGRRRALRSPSSAGARLPSCSARRSTRGWTRDSTGRRRGVRRAAHRGRHARGRGRAPRGPRRPGDAPRPSARRISWSWRGSAPDRSPMTRAPRRPMPARSRPTRHPRRRRRGSGALAGERRVRSATEGDPRRRHDGAEWVAASLGGEARAQAPALERLAATASPALVPRAPGRRRRSLPGLRRPASARRVAERATQADPTSVRSVASLADAVLGEAGPRGRGRPRARGGARRAARAVVLRPGRRRSTRSARPSLPWAGASAPSLFGPATATPSSASSNASSRRKIRGALGDALAWLLSQPQPGAWLAEPFAHAFASSRSSTRTARAVVARRALDVLGPESAPLRDAMLDVAASASEHASRRRSSSAGPRAAPRARSDRPARARSRTCASAWATTRRGARRGPRRARGRRVSRDRRAPGAPGTDRDRWRPDAQLWRLRARAERLAPGDPDAAAWAWRELGAALWDLADDRVGALEAWRRAARASARAGTRRWRSISSRSPTEVRVRLARAGDRGRSQTTRRRPPSRPTWRARRSRRQSPTSRSISPRAASRAARRAPTRSRWPSGRPTARASTPRCPALYELVAARALGPVRPPRRALPGGSLLRAPRRARSGAEARGAGVLRRALGGLELPAPRAGGRAGGRSGPGGPDRRAGGRAVESRRRPARRGCCARRASRATAKRARAARWTFCCARPWRRRTSRRSRCCATRDASCCASDPRSATRPRDAPRPGRARHHRTPRRPRGGARGDRVRADVARALRGRGRSAVVDRARLRLRRATSTSSPSSRPARPTLGAAQDARGRTARAARRAPRARTRTSGSPALRLRRGHRGRAWATTGCGARTSVAAALRDPDDDALVIEADAAVRAVPALRRAPRRSGAARAPRGGAAGDGAGARAEGGARRRGAALRARGRPGRRGASARRSSASCAPPGRPPGAAARSRRACSARRRARRLARDARRPLDRDRRAARDARRQGRRGARAARGLQARSRADATAGARWSAWPRSRATTRRAWPRSRQIATRVGRRRARRRCSSDSRGRTSGAATPRPPSAHGSRVLALDAEDEEADHAVEALIVDARSLRRAGRSPGAPRRAPERPVREAGDAARGAAAPRGHPRAATRARCTRRATSSRCCSASGPTTRARSATWPICSTGRGSTRRPRPLWRARRPLESDPAERDELELRAGRASLAAGDTAAAMGHARACSARSRRTARPGAARRGGAARSARTASSAMRSRRSRRARPSTPARGAICCSRRRRRPRARATLAGRSSERMAPPRRRRSARPRSCSRAALEYRLRGAGAPDEARRTIEELAAIREPLGPRRRRAARVSAGRGARRRAGRGRGSAASWRPTRAVIGDHPLVALGLAERLRRRWASTAAAVDAYRVALSRVAARSAQAGQRGARRGRRGAARRRAMHDAAHFLEHRAAPPGDVRGLAQQAQLRALRGAPPRRASDARRWTTPPTARGRGRRRRLEELEAAVRAATTPGERARRAAGARPRAPRAGRRARRRAAPVGGPGRRARRSGRRPRRRAHRPSPTARAMSCASAASRSRSSPETSAASSLLRAAALADDDRVFARAVEHVLRAFDAGAGLCRRRRSPPSPSSRASSRCLRARRWTRRARRSRSSGRARCSSSCATRRATGSPASSAWCRAHVRHRAPLRGGACGCSTRRASRSSCRARPPGRRSAHVALLSPPRSSSAATSARNGRSCAIALGRGMSAATAHNVLRLGLPPAEGRRARRGHARRLRSPGDRAARRRPRGAAGRVLLADRPRAHAAAPPGAPRHGGVRGVRGARRARRAERAAGRDVPRGGLRVARRGRSWPSRGSTPARRRRSRRFATSATGCRRSRTSCASR